MAATSHRTGITNSHLISSRSSSKIPNRLSTCRCSIVISSKARSARRVHFRIFSWTGESRLLRLHEHRVPAPPVTPNKPLRRGAVPKGAWEMTGRMRDGVVMLLWNMTRTMGTAWRSRCTVTGWLGRGTAATRSTRCWRMRRCLDSRGGSWRLLEGIFCVFFVYFLCGGVLIASVVSPFDAAPVFGCVVSCCARRIRFFCSHPVVVTARVQKVERSHTRYGCLILLFVCPSLLLPYVPLEQTTENM